MQKGFIPLVIILALAVLAASGAAFVLTRTTGHGLQNYDIKSTNSEPANKQISDETANWKTYRNEKYGFEVQYPPDWEAKEIKTGGQIIFYIGFKPKNLTGETLANVIGSKGKLEGYLGVQFEKQHNDLLFTLQNSGGSDYLNLENQILSTFKFVEPK